MPPQGAHHQQKFECGGPGSWSSEPLAQHAALVLAGIAQGAALVCAVLYDSLLCIEPSALARSVLQNRYRAARHFLCPRTAWLEVAARKHGRQASISSLLFLYGQSRIIGGLCKMLPRRSFGNMGASTAKTTESSVATNRG